MKVENLLDAQLYKLGIYELRSLAREVGVKSPTTKKREQLVEQIKAISSGELKPIKNGKFGRPVKKLITKDNMLANFITKGDEYLEDKITSMNGVSDFVFEQPICLDNNPLNFNLITFCGILRKTAQNNYFVLNSLKLSSKIYVILSDDMIGKYRLVEGDKIEGTAYKHQVKEFAQVNTIEKINDLLPNDNQDSLYLDLVIPFKQMPKDDLLYGQSKFIKVNTNEEILQVISERVDAIIKDSQASCVVLSLETSLESKLRLDKVENISQIVSLFDDSNEFSYEKIMDAINYMNALFSRKRNAVLFIVYPFRFFRILDLFFNEEGKHSLKTIQVMKKLIGLCKASQESSISSYLICDVKDEINYEEEYETFKRIVK